MTCFKHSASYLLARYRAILSFTLLNALQTHGPDGKGAAAQHTRNQRYPVDAIALVYCLLVTNKLTGVLKTPVSAYLGQLYRS